MANTVKLDLREEIRLAEARSDEAFLNFLKGNVTDLSGNNQILLAKLRSDEDLENFIKATKRWLYPEKFERICRRYEFPRKPLSVVIDDYYIDSAYRDIYYHYLSKLHFQLPRHCTRLFLFQRECAPEDFLDETAQENLQADFLGTIVIRPAYSSDKLAHTFGVTLLDPLKMAFLEDDKLLPRHADGNIRYPQYLLRRQYSAHLLGATYTVMAFPFSGQDGVVLTCAENAIETLCDYAGRSSSLCSKILPSDIQKHLKLRFPQRIVPSHGLDTEDISYLLRKLSFSPVIYRRGFDTGIISELDFPSDSRTENGGKEAVDDLKKRMEAAAKDQNFELAAKLRDRIQSLEQNIRKEATRKKPGTCTQKNLDAMKEELAEAVREKEFERAAELRNQILRMERFIQMEAEQSEIPFWHETDYRKRFHYYVESGLPILMISAPDAITRALEDANKHATLVIGHGSRQKPLEECKNALRSVNGLSVIDTAELYEDYIIQDDNQIPYVEERFDKFTSAKSYKSDSYIVPLPRHVFLEADNAVGICDIIISKLCELLNDALEKIQQLAHNIFDAADTNDEQELKAAQKLLKSAKTSEKNPIVVRYFLAGSASYKQSRIRNNAPEDMPFYASVPMPKSVWLAEISTYKLYQDGYAFAEIALDATASKLSKLNSVLLLRFGNQGGFRMPDESYDELLDRINGDEYAKLSAFYPMLSNFH